MKKYINDQDLFVRAPPVKDSWKVRNGYTLWFEGRASEGAIILMSEEGPQARFENLGMALRCFPKVGLAKVLW